MSALDHARGLLLMVRKDFDAMRGMTGNPLFADEVFGFHAQQAIEKALKAWLAGRSRCRCQSFWARSHPMFFIQGGLGHLVPKLPKRYIA